MPMWTVLTLEGMRAGDVDTLADDIGDWIKDNMTKREVMEWLFETKVFLDAPVFTYDGQGRKTGRKQVGRYVETGSQKKNSEVGYIYYPNGDVEDITIVHRDENDEIVEQCTIHHYQDDRQPVRIDA